MKKNRVLVTLAAAIALVVAFLVVPLPVSRLVDTGLVSLDPAHATPLGPQEQAVLVRLAVAEGDEVRPGQLLAEFTSPRLNEELGRTTAEREAAVARASNLRTHATTVGSKDPTGQLRQEAEQADNRVRELDLLVEAFQKRLADARTLSAPVAGFAMGVPRSGDLGKLYERNFQEGRPVLTIGDPTRLVVKLPVSSLDYRLLQEELPRSGELEAAVYVAGRTDREYRARVRLLPQADSKQLPPQLTQRGGGSIAVKQSGEDGRETTPVAQVYLVDVELLDPDASVRPGTLVQVKVYCRWRSAAWWVKRKLAEALDLGLYQ